MRMTTFLLLVTCLHVSANSYSQKISLSVKDAPLQGVFTEIITQTGVSIVYDEALLQAAAPVTIHVKDAPLLQVLDLCLKDQPLSYSVAGRKIYIRQVPKSSQDTLYTLRGKVSDKAGQALPGVSIRVRTRNILTTEGTTSKPDGTFSLRTRLTEGTLVFSFTGYKTESRAFIRGGEFTMVMQDDIAALEEVVVVGYGTEKKRDVTGAIVSVSAESMEERQPVDVFDALQGQTPGVQITSGSGAPGESSTIRIRGTATFDAGVSPLYIVDGARVDDISLINPNDIASVEILKDAASAAIYGSRSANGVVIISTKRGKEGKPRFDLRYLQSFKSMAHKIPQASATDRRFHTPTGAQEIDSLNPAYNSDNYYQDLLTRTAIRHQVDLSARGASKTLNYSASLGYLDDQGIVVNSYAKLIRSRLNFDFHLNNKAILGNRIQLSYKTGNRINEGSVLLQGVLRPANYRVYLDDGGLAGLVQARPNPVAWAMYYKNRLDEYQANIYNYFTYQITKHLKYTTDVTANVIYNHNFIFSPRILSNVNDNSGTDRRDMNIYLQHQGYFNYGQTFGKHAVTAVLGYSVDKDTRRYSTISGTNFLTEAIETFNSAQLLNQNNTFTFASRNTSVSAFGRLGYNFRGRYLLNANVRADGSSRFGRDKRWGVFPSVSGAWRVSDESFMGWARKFLDDAKVRLSYGMTGNDRIGDYDAIQSYRFGSFFYNGVSGVVPNSLFGNNTLGWESTRQLNAGIDISLFRNRLSFAADYYNKTTSDLLYSAPLPDESGYTSVKVNVGSIRNRGFEFGINGMPVKTKNFNWSVNYNMSFNQTHVLKLYQGTGLISIAGTTTWSIQEGEKLGNFYGWKSEGVYAYNEANAYTSEWERLTPIFKDGSFQGYSLNGEAYTGQVKKMTASGNTLRGGDVIWQNTTKDGVIDDADRVVIGNAQPKFTAGLNNNFGYKRFTLSVSFYSSWGGQLFNYARYYLNSYKSATVTPEPEVIYNRWRAPGDVTIYPRSGNFAYNQREISSNYIEDASFIRLRNARLTYNLPSAAYSRIKLKGVSVYVYGTNLLTWTNYRWFDPEIAPGPPLTMGKDNGRYPRNREVGMGLNVNF